MKSLFGYMVPGALLVLAGFWAGGQPNPTLGMLSFLCFFVLGVSLIIEGWKRRNKSEK